MFHYTSMQEQKQSGGMQQLWDWFHCAGVSGEQFLQTSKICCSMPVSYTHLCLSGLFLRLENRTATLFVTLSDTHQLSVQSPNESRWRCSRQTAHSSLRSAVNTAMTSTKRATQTPGCLSTSLSRKRQNCLLSRRRSSPSESQQSDEGLSLIHIQMCIRDSPSAAFLSTADPLMMWRSWRTGDCIFVTSCRFPRSVAALSWCWAPAVIRLL